MFTKERVRLFALCFLFAAIGNIATESFSFDLLSEANIRTKENLLKEIEEKNETISKCMELLDGKFQ